MFFELKSGHSNAFLGIEGDSGAARTIDYLTLIGLAKIAGHTPFGGFGQRSACSADALGDDCWEGTAITCPIPDQVAGEQLTILCANAQDSSAGTGIRTLDVHGLDIDGNPQSEIVTLNGGSVNTVRTNWRFNQAIHGESWGLARPPDSFQFIAPVTRRASTTSLKLAAACR